MRHTLLKTLAAAVVAAACSDGPTPLPVVAGAVLQVVNGAKSAGPLTVYVDGAKVGGTVSPGAASGALPVFPGTRTIELRSAGGTGFTRTATFLEARGVVVVGLDSAGRITPALLSDTNAIVPAGTTKLRVAHMAQSAGPIDIWRTQPDFGTPIRVMFPFRYRDVSPYLQSTPGDWRVMVSDTVPAATPNAPMPDTLANSGLIPVLAGTSRTAVVVDKAGGGVTVVVVDP
jgi:hypothetical protein